MVTGLVLQGGGALGAFELGVIEWLLDHEISPDVVSGVSIGAVNAAVLAGSKHGDPRKDLRGLWADLTTPTLPPPLALANGQVSLFGNPGMYAPRVDYLDLWRWTSFYETGPLRATLSKFVDFDKLKPGAPQSPQLILTATNLASGRLDRFDSRKMAPTFRLQLGAAGASSAIEIARRVGLPEALCARATDLAQNAGGALSKALAAAQDEQRKLADARDAADKELNELLAKGEKRDDEEEARYEELATLLHRD